MSLNDFPMSPQEPDEAMGASFEFVAPEADVYPAFAGQPRMGRVVALLPKQDGVVGPYNNNPGVLCDVITWGFDGDGYQHHVEKDVVVTYTLMISALRRKGLAPMIGRMGEAGRAYRLEPIAAEDSQQAALEYRRLLELGGGELIGSPNSIYGDDRS